MHPVLTLYAGPNVIATNDRWSTAVDSRALARAMVMVGGFPLGVESDDAAVLVTLPAGAYSIEVKGKGESGGTVLLEVYDVP
jgi:hypothetical protein